MREFMQAGGYAMWMVLLFGLVGLGTSARFAWRPREGSVAVLRALSQAVLYASLSGMAAGFAAVASHVPANPEWAHSPDLALIVMAGIGESLANGILGFTILALMWLLSAVGARKLAA